MKPITFTVPGIPVAKGRPRVCKTHTFTPQKTKDAEYNIQVYALQAGVKCIEAPAEVKLEVSFHFPYTKSYPKRLRTEGLPEPHTSRPDLDNLLKTVKDGLNKIAYDDDSQVTVVVMRKDRRINPGTEITITPKNS